MFAANKLIVTLTRTGLFALAFAASIAGAGAAPSLMTPIMGAKNVRSQFDIKSEPTPIMLNRAALAKLKIQDEFEFALPNATRQIIIFDRIEDHGGGIRSSVGYLKDHGKDFRVIITSGPSGSFGSIRTPDTIYRIIPGPSGQDLLVNMTEEQKFIPFIDLGNDVRRIPEDVNQQANTDAILSNLKRPVNGVSGRRSPFSYSAHISSP